ncbi:DUF2877 domain-containing protein [Cryptosporangium phraense]|uniref:DUF2877 domain-containing protein n=1 Tax=Cryptosporangium phraense TaxID=2593070 RepID=A0A545AFG3_9ACTN|nr:DUF2877 domain-containing protein [Cryptosporangium phraense]TQS40072.1 DUF2877 domain-containing protein [Cryptosporangium phraense]
MDVHTTLPCAASVSVAPILTGPVQPLPVIASLSAALYVGPFCVTSAEAVRVPCALVLGPGVPVPSATVGSTAEVGDGQVHLPGLTVAVTRWWQPSRPVLHDDPYARQRAIRPVGIGATELNVGTLLGRGDGLTPLGDDILAGALVTLVAAAHPHGEVLGSMVTRELAAHPETATTPVSALLLRHATQGECIPELAAVLTDPADRLDPAIDALLAIGHTSGKGLLHGVRMGLEVLTEGRASASR